MSPYSLQRFCCCALILVVAAVFLTAGCNPDLSDQTSSAPKASALPVAPPPPVVEWKSDPALLDQLEPYQDVEDYQIRLPKECNPRFIPANAVPYAKMKFWETPVRTDNTQFQFGMMIAKVPPTVPDYALTAEQELNVILQGFKKSCRFSDWQQTPVESGQIGGVPFVRISFQGVLNGVNGHGFYYVTKNAGTFVAISIVDFEPHSKESLNLGTASILTFRNK